VGPCINIIPVRARIDPSRTSGELLAATQEQHHSVGLAETCDFEDIFRECTQWPADTTLDSVFQYQNIEETLNFEVDGVSRRLVGFEYPDSLPLLFVLVVYPAGERLRIRINANTHIVSLASAKKILDSLCDTVPRLSADPKAALTAFTRHHPFGATHQDPSELQTMFEDDSKARQ
jgi:hypothetical protein